MSQEEDTPFWRGIGSTPDDHFPIGLHHFPLIEVPDRGSELHVLCCVCRREGRFTGLDLIRRFPDWLTRAQWMGRAAKVGDLQRQGWPVVACCLHCSLEMTVDLAVVRRALGEDFVLWGRTARCRRRHCQGRMYFWTYPPEGRGLRVEMF